MHYPVYIIAALLGNTMCMEVSTMRSSLTTLSSSLNLEPDIKSSIDQIISRGRDCLHRYESIITNEGGALLVQKELIVASKSPEEVNVQDMQTALDDITSKMTAVRDTSLSLQTDVYSNIELCRGRKQMYETTIENDKQTSNAIAAEIQGIYKQIETFEAEMTSIEKDALKLENRAVEIDRQAAEEKDKRECDIIALEPFSGNYEGVNVDDAESCRRGASDRRASAQNRRNDAQRLREQNTGAVYSKTALEQKLQDLKSKTVQLESTIIALQQMTLGLKNLVKNIEIALDVFQTMATTFKDVILQSSFLTIQNALKEHPERIAENAQAMMEELKEKWSNMEAVLIANGARAILTCDTSGINC